MSNPIYRSGKVIAEMIEMNKVIAVSALAMAGMLRCTGNSGHYHLFFF
ncbi:hypothetical protein HMPREF9531_00686 [Escherichia coli MS 45-1]|nr:hypothetical protein HMPREF9531_00686 [Escherichia coli MS 45-1]KXH01719.1 hypothetical protein HMPREF3041_00088 [Escherichia coli]